MDESQEEAPVDLSQHLLHAAARDGAVEELAELLINGENPNDRCPFGRTALIYAVHGRHKQCVDVLLQAGAEINAVDHDKVSCCHWAVSNTDYKMLKYLLENGADWTLQDTDDRSALHYAVGVETTKCLQAIVKYVTPDQSAAISRKDVDGLSALMFAMHHGQARHAMILIQLGADTLEKDAQGKLPLHWAADLGDLELTRCLLEVNDTVDDIVELDAEGTAPLHLSVARGHIEVVKLMVDMRPSSDFNVRDNTGRTPLHWAAASGYVDIVSLLCEVDSVDVNISDNYGATACHYAAQQPESNACVLALLQHGVQCLADTDGRIPLHWAMLENNQPCIEALLSDDNRFESAALQDNDGRNALHMAAVMGSVQMCHTVLECTDNVDVEDATGKTAIFPACEQGNEELVALIVERNADLTHTDAEGRTPLHWACVNGHQQVAALLLSAGSPAETVDTSGKTCLMFAAFQGNEELVRLLLERGVEVDAQDNEGITAMHWAALEGFIEVVRALLDAGGNPNLMEVNDSKSTVLDYALINNHVAVMTLLRDHHALLNSEIQHIAAITIQTAWRGCMAQRAARQQIAEAYAQTASPAEHEAATQIATSFRAFAARKNYRRKKKEHDAAMFAKQTEAATTIQKHFRGHQSRQSLFRTKEGKAFQAHYKLRRAEAMRAQAASYSAAAVGNKGSAASSLRTRRTTRESSRTPSPRATTRRHAPLDTGLKRTGQSLPKKARPAQTKSADSGEHAAKWDDFEFVPKAGESYVNAYIRFSKLKEQRRANQDKLLLAVLKQPLGPGDSHPADGASSDPNAAADTTRESPRMLNMLTSYKTKHVTRIMERKRITRTQEVLHSVLTIQRAWRRYVVRKHAAARRGITFAPMSHYAATVRTARSQAGALGTTPAPSAPGAGAPSPSRRGHRSTGRTGRTGRTLERSLGVLRATGGHNRTSTRRKVLPAIPPAASPRRRVPRQQKASGTRMERTGRQLPSCTRGSVRSVISSSNPAVQKKIELNALHAQAAAARTRARKGWNDDPHYEPVTDRFSKRHYPPLRVRRVTKRAAHRWQPPLIRRERKPVEWIA
eukprot:m.949363 g.949363  ORF g.949363 m.949363 type:complete len:1074 (-) comp23852_c0_seq1:2306-5527(-)